MTKMVIYSPGYGAGWSTWGDRQSALDQELAQAIVDKKSIDEINQIAEKNWPGQYKGGLAKAKVECLAEGTRFRIEEYDGHESIILFSDDTYLVA